MDPEKTKTPTNDTEGGHNQPTTAPEPDQTNNAAELNDALAVAREAADAAADAAEDAVDAHGGKSASQDAQTLHAQPQAAERPAYETSEINDEPTNTSDAPAQTPYDPFITKTQKSHKGRNAAIAILVILILALGGGAIWLFAYYNQPNQLALDSITKLLNAEHVSMQGTATSMMTYEDGDDAYTTTINMNANYNKSGAQQVTVEYTNDDFAGSELGALSMTAQRNDGQLFVNVSGVDDLLGTYLNAYSDDTYCGDETCYSLDAEMQVDSNATTETDETTSETDEAAGESDEATTSEDAGNTSEDLYVDDTWWQIDPAALVGYFGLDEKLGETATCLLSDNNIASLSSSLATAYGEHPFMAATDYTGSEFKSDQRLIKIDFDEAALADFIFDYYNNSLKPAIEQCTDASLDAISADDAREYAESLAGEQEYTMVLAVNFWSHELVNYYYSATVDDDYYQTAASYEISFEYPTALSISAPDEYEDITSLLERLGIGNEAIELYETNLDVNLVL